MNAYHPTNAEISDAEQFFGQPATTSAHDYCIDHSEKAPLPKIAPRIGKAPIVAAEAIALGQELCLPISGINDPLTKRGMTLLHLAALLYSKSAGSYAMGSRERAQYYERVCRMLLDAGADPHARMSMDGFFEGLHTPAAVCNGIQPLCLRARMLREATDGRCEVKHKSRPVAAHTRVDPRKSTAPKRRCRQARGVTDTGTGWLVRAMDGVEVGFVAYGSVHTDRWSKHRVAILLREQYEHGKGFSNARLRRA